MMSDFLSPEDREFLDSNYSEKFEIVESEVRGLIIRDYRLPTGYQPDKTDLMLLVPPDYPVAVLDMFYFNPPIRRDDRIGIAGLTHEIYFGVEWQRWSRHYHNEWRPGIDGIATHITFVGNQLKSELGLP